MSMRIEERPTLIKKIICLGTELIMSLIPKDNYKNKSITTIMNQEENPFQIIHNDIKIHTHKIDKINK